MFVYQPNEWLVRRRTIIRIVLSSSTLVCALLVYPTAVLMLSVIALALYGAYEVLIAGIILDALLAPGTSMLGEYAYTATLLVLAFCIYIIRTILRGTRTQ